MNVVFVVVVVAGSLRLRPQHRHRDRGEDPHADAGGGLQLLRPVARLLQLLRALPSDRGPGPGQVLRGPRLRVGLPGQGPGLDRRQDHGQVQGLPGAVPQGLQDQRPAFHRNLDALLTTITQNKRKFRCDRPDQTFRNFRALKSIDVSGGSMIVENARSGRATHIQKYVHNTFTQQPEIKRKRISLVHIRQRYS